MQCMECLEDIATSELLAGLALSDHSEDVQVAYHRADADKLLRAINIVFDPGAEWEMISL
jgi:hypothetical protein